MIPTIGTIVLYTLNANDAADIYRRRRDWSTSEIGHEHSGVQAHYGNSSVEGHTLPAIIVKTWGMTEEASCNIQVFLDGNDVLWKTSVREGEGPGHWKAS